MEHDLYQDSEPEEEEANVDAAAEAEVIAASAGADTRKLPALQTDFPEVDVTSNERTMAALAHGSIVLTLLTGGFAGWIVALVIWAVYRKESRWVANQSLQALVFQVAATLVTYVLLSIAGVVFGLGTLLLIIVVGVCLFPVALILALTGVLVPLAATVYGLFGALETYQGRDFQYWWVGQLVADRLTS